MSSQIRSSFPKTKWCQLRFIFQVSHFDPNSGVGISVGGIASKQRVLQQTFLPKKTCLNKLLFLAIARIFSALQEGENYPPLKLKSIVWCVGNFQVIYVIFAWFSFCSYFFLIKFVCALETFSQEHLRSQAGCWAWPKILFVLISCNHPSLYLHPQL